MRHHRTWILLAALPFLGVLAVLATDRLLMPMYTRQGSESILPDLGGMDSSAARELLLQKGFRVRFEKGRADFSGERPAGTILEQFPPAGSRTKSGRRVYLRPSLGEIRVDVPDLLGLTRREAAVLLADLGLAEDSLALSWRFDSLQGRGTVLEQEPGAGESLSRGETVGFVLSLGPEPDRVRVPSLLGLDLEAVERRLKEHGLALGRVDFEVHPDRPPGVRVQLPVANQQVPPGDSVDVRVNRGGSEG